jgi:thiosulfate/3-mercaptopyruvate sulfurtransferase
MSGLARPEILATTEWLAEHLGRAGVIVLDARWRPDGTGAEVHRAGHIPGAVSVDWRSDLVDMDQTGDTIRVASPGRVAATAARAGIGDETTIVVYDDTQGLYASRVWWTFRTYGAEHVRILDGGFPAWAAEGRPIERGAGDPAPEPLTPFDRLHAANVSRGSRMVAYDGSGVAAAKLAFILSLLGHDDVAVYDGGWAEWGNRLDLPVDR